MNKIEGLALAMIDYMNNKLSAIVIGATSGIGYEVAKVLAKPVITVNWLYRLLVFFWQMIPRFIWIRIKIK